MIYSLLRLYSWPTWKTRRRLPLLNIIHHCGFMRAEKNSHYKSQLIFIFPTPPRVIVLLKRSISAASLCTLDVENFPPPQGSLLCAVAGADFLLCLLRAYIPFVAHREAFLTVQCEVLFCFVAAEMRRVAHYTYMTAGRKNALRHWKIYFV